MCNLYSIFILFIPFQVVVLHCPLARISWFFLLVFWQWNLEHLFALVACSFSEGSLHFLWISISWTLSPLPDFLLSFPSMFADCPNFVWLLNNENWQSFPSAASNTVFCLHRNNCLQLKGSYEPSLYFFFKKHWLPNLPLLHVSGMNVGLWVPF